MYLMLAALKITSKASWISKVFLSINKTKIRFAAWTRDLFNSWFVFEQFPMHINHTFQCTVCKCKFERLGSTPTKVFLSNVFLLLGPLCHALRSKANSRTNITKNSWLYSLTKSKLSLILSKKIKARIQFAVDWSNHFLSSHSSAAILGGKKFQIKYLCKSRTQFSVNEMKFMTI